MQKITDYELISDCFLSILNRKVNSYIKAGYQPYEKPFSVGKNGTEHYCQAMVKYEKN